MEASAILKMVEDAYYDQFFIIDVIFINDDSIMWAVINYPSIGVRGQVLKSSKVKLDEGIPEPSFLAAKVFAKHIFSIVNKSGFQRCGCPKPDALRLKKDWGNMVKKNSENILTVEWVK